MYLHSRQDSRVALMNTVDQQNFGHLAGIFGSCPKSVIGVEGLSIQGVPVRGVLRSTLMRHPYRARLGGRRRCQTLTDATRHLRREGITLESWSPREP